MEKEKTKAEIRAERVKNINKARKKMIDAKIAEAEAENIQKIADANERAAKESAKADRAKTEAEAERLARKDAELKHQQKSQENIELKEKLDDKRKKAAAANARAERAKAQAAEEKRIKENAQYYHRKKVAENAELKEKLAERKYEKDLAEAKAERAKAQAAEEKRIKENARFYHHKKVVENAQLKAELRTRKKAVGAQKMALSAICLGIGAVLFALLYVLLFAAYNNKWGGESITASLQVSYVVFYCLADAAIIGLLTLIIPIFGTLRKEGHLNTLSTVSMIIIWIVSAFAFAIYIVTIISAVNPNLIEWKNTEEILSYLATALTLVLLAFSVTLYISVKRSYKHVALDK